MSNYLEILQEKSSSWKSMDRTTEDLRKKTEEYYDDEIMPVLLEVFKERYNENVNCEALILTLGTSYEPLVLSISVLKPKKVLFLHTRETLHLLDNVIRFTNLLPSQYERQEVDASSPLKLYSKVKETYLKWGKPKNIYADFTGGTKSMAAGCAMAGAVIGAKLVYVSSRYLSDLRKADPGSEKLEFIDNPYVVFGDLDRQQAISLFNLGDFISAGNIFESLALTVPNAETEYEALCYLSEAYDAWDSLDFKNAKSSLEKCVGITKRECLLNDHFILKPHAEKLNRQLEIVSKLGNIYNQKNLNKKDVFDNIGYMIFNLYENAARKSSQEKFEMASLLLYRILEMIEQKRLWNYGIDVSRADYRNINISSKYSNYTSSTEVSEANLLMAVNNVLNKTKSLNRPMKELKREITLVMGYIILAALKDKVFKGKGSSEPQLLENLKSKVDARNSSIFAHGFEFIDKSRFLNFKELVDNYLDNFCALENIDKEDLYSAMQFVRL